MKCLRVLTILAAVFALGQAVTLPGVPAVFSGNIQIASAISADIAQKFADEYIKFMRTGVESAALLQLSHQLASSHSDRNLLMINFDDDLDAIDQFFACTACRAGVRVIVNEFRTPNGELNGPEGQERLRVLAGDICNRLKLGPPTYCAAYLDESYAFIEFIAHETNANEQTACSILPFPICKVKQDEFNLTLPVDQNGPPVTGSKSDFPGKSEKDIHILHLTDIHYDPDYKPGSLAACNGMLCCREEGTGNIEPGHQAGYWSDYRYCDSPLHMVHNAFDHIKATHTNIDYIYYTGDVVPHNFWETSKDFNKKIIKEVDSWVAEKFPGIPVYPVVGNHESHPTNLFGTTDLPGQVCIKWLYQTLWDSWSRWLPADTEDTILEGGFYTVSPYKGFRIISLNSNYGYIYNFFLFHDVGIAERQLLWLHEILLAAEKNNEHVHILTHMASGISESWTIFGREFNRIIERFHHIIGGIFVGHTHRDELHVHYNHEGHALGHTFNGGSLTAYANTNPNYKLYEANRETLQVVDFHTWMFNVTEANEKGEGESPRWRKAYTFSEEFTDDLSPAGLHMLLDKMAKNPDLLHKYWSYQSVLSDPKLEWGCDNRCLLRTICQAAKTVHDQTGKCREFQDILRPNLPGGETTTTATPSTTASSTQSTQSTQPGETTTKKPGGAASIVAMSMATLLALSSFVRMIV